MQLEKIVDEQPIQIDRVEETIGDEAQHKQQFVNFEFPEKKTTDDYPTNTPRLTECDALKQLTQRVDSKINERIIQSLSGSEEKLRTVTGRLKGTVTSLLS